MEAKAEIRNWKKPFFTVWTGQTISLLGSSLVQFALVWWLTSTTNSASVLATATLMGYLPQVFLSPFVGALIDRLNRRKVMIFADGGIALVSLILAILFWLGVIQVWHVYVVLFIRSVGDIFHRPSMQASTSLMVPENQFSRIAGLNQALSAVTMIMSPPLGALLVSILPFHKIIAIDVITAFLAIVPLLFIPIPQPKRNFTTEIYTPALLLKDVASGLRYLSNLKGLLILCILFSFVGFFGNPLVSIMPLLVTRHFHGGATQLGWLEFTAGVSMLVSAIVLSIWGGTKRKIITILGSLMMSGVSSLIVGWTPPDAFWLTLVGAVIFGFMGPFTNGCFRAIVQSRVDPEIQGRVFSINTTITQGIVPLGLLAAAWMVEKIGVTFPFTLAGFVLLVTCLLGFFIPSVMSVEDKPQQAEPSLASNTIKSTV
jgi:MFS transporter, DHA3 family, macrolide efflux protein